jgi:hydroxymethylbilane synthase
VDTRVRQLVDGEVGALVLAMAGVRRLGIDSVQVRPIPPTVCVPAVGQGALAVEARTSDYALRSRLAALTDPISLAQVTAERAFLHRLGGGCLAPASAHASGGEGGMVIGAFVADPDGVAMISATERCALSEAKRTAEVLADRLLLAGAVRLLHDSRARARPADGTG